MAQVKETAVVYSQEELAPEIFSMWITTETAKEAKPGQFISVYSKDGSRLLPRPISICEADPEEGRLRIVYRIAGAGTKEFSSFESGDPIDIMGPLGNGFPQEGENVFLIGGGIGIPPMLELAKNLNCEKQMILGYRDGNLFLRDEFEAYGEVFVATEDGSAGTKGNVLDAIRENGLTADVMYACGPTPMLRALKQYVIFPWKKKWPAGLEHVLPASAKAARWITTAMSIISGSAKTVPYFWPRRWIYDEYKSKSGRSGA